jgi:hypothetical protein
MSSQTTAIRDTAGTKMSLKGRRMLKSDFLHRLVNRLAQLFHLFPPAGGV